MVHGLICRSYGVPQVYWLGYGMVKYGVFGSGLRYPSDGEDSGDFCDTKRWTDLGLKASMMYLIAEHARCR